MTQPAMPGAATPHHQPASDTTADRIASLDFTRGIAVLGILAANIVAFGQPMQAYMYPGAFTTPHGPAEDAMWVAQFLLVDGKMRGLFTLLFGAGLYLFMERAWARGEGRSRQARRLFWLGVIGLAHFFLLWRGDILFNYAVAGFVALAFVQLSARRQLWLGIVGYLAGCLIYGAMTIGMERTATRPPGPATAAMHSDLAMQKAADLAEGRAETALIQGDGYAAYIAHNVTRHAADPLFMAGFFLLESAPLMLIGMALFRLGLFNGGLDARRQLRWGWTGIVLGTALSIPIALWALATGLGYWPTLAAFMGWQMLPRLLVVLGLAALLARYAPRATGWLGQRVSAAGRTAFTNYLGTSVLMVAIFHGLNLFGRLSRGELYLVMFIGWAAMLAWPLWWLARYRYGPLEWLWRSLTYGRRMPMRR